MILDDLAKTLQGRLRAAHDRLAVKKAAEARLAQIDAARAALVVEEAHNETARVVLQAIEKTQHETLKARIEDLTSFALRSIFDRPLQFEVEFEQRASQTEARFKIKDEHGTAVGLRDAHGGGLLVVASFVLRVVVLMSIRPRLAPLLVIDEPFVQVSAEYRDRLVDFVKKLAESSGVQFLIVTHMPELAAVGDKRYRFRLRNGLTETEEI